MKKFLLVLLSLCFFVTAFSGCDTGNGSKKESNALDYLKTDSVEGTHIFNISETDKKIVSGGKTDYKVVFPAEPTEMEQNAVDELLYFFKEATGISIESVEDGNISYDDSSKYLSVGHTDLLKDAGITPDYSVLGESGLRIVTKGSTVFMFGAEASSRGNLYAVYEFLAQCFHYEYFSDNIIRLDKDVTELVLMDYDITDVPDYQYNIANYGFIRNNEVARRRYRMLRDDELIIPVDGVINHNSFKWLPKSEHQEKHSKWYSNDGTQLCYTAHGIESEYKEMVRVVTEKMKTVLQDERYLDRNIITFTHEDTQTWCECETCSTMREDYNGANSASVIKFLNEIKANIDAWFETDDGKPYAREDFKIFFFGYHQTNQPPVTYDAATDTYSPIDNTVKCRDGVAVYFAETNGDYTQSFYEKNNSSIASNLRGWGAVTEDIFFWIYQTNFTYYLTPYNSFNSMQDNYKYGVLHNAMLMFDQGQFNEDGKPTGWSMLKVYLTSKLAWNVNFDFNQLINNFFDAYFGPAAATMKGMFESFRVRALYNEQYNGYQGSRSVFTNAVRDVFWPKPLLQSWLDTVEKALSEIEYLRDTDPVQYEAYRFNICLERLGPLYMMVEIYSSSLSESIVSAYKTQFFTDANMAGLIYEGEKSNISNLYSRWGI